MSRRSRSFNAFEQATTAAIDDAVTSIPLDSVENLTPPGYLVIDPDNPLLREYIFYTEINALVLDNVSRGLEGSAGNIAQEHSSGARVRAVSVHQWLNDIFDDIEDLEAADLLLLDLAGTRAMTGNLDMGSTNRIVDLANGIADQDAATVKQSVQEAGDTMTGALKISLATGGQLELEDPGGAAPDTSLIGHDEGVLTLGNKLSVDQGAAQINAGYKIVVDAASDTFKATYSISQILLGEPGSGASAATSFLSLFAGGDQAYDARIVAVNGTPAVLGDADLQLRARSTSIVSDAGANAAILAVDGQVFTFAGTPTDPPHSFNLDPDTGMYLISTGVLGFAAGGTRRLSVSGTQVTVGDGTAGPAILHIAPSVTTPAYAFAGDSGTGLLNGTPGQTIVASQGIRQFSVSSNAVLVGNGATAGTAWMEPVAPSVALPGYAFNSNIDMGMFRVSANRIGWSTSGVSRMQLASGEFICTPVFSNTAAADGDVHVNSGGTLFRVTSSLAVKENFAPLDDAFDVIRRLNPFTFDSLLPADAGERFAGFGAEEVIEVIPEAANATGDNYQNRAILAYLTKAVQQLIEERTT